MAEDKLGIGVVSFNRPKHLYVTLDSITRMHQIDQVTVCAFLIENETLVDKIAIIDDLPVRQVIIKQRGGDAFMYALYYLFYIQDCSHVILFGDDQIGRTDTIDYVLTLKDDNPLVFADVLGGVSEECLGKILRGIDTSGSTRLLKSHFDILQAWLDTDNCIESLDTNFRPSPSLNRYDFDYFLVRYMAPRGYLTRYAPIRYCMCFGVCGLHGPNTPEAYDFENNRFFAGDKRTWLDNITCILASDEELPYDVSRMLLPRHYIYE